MSLVFLDANIVMYAAGGAHPLRDPCRQALRTAVEQDIPLVTSSEVLQEILHRYFAIGRPEIAREVFETTRDLCQQVAAVEEADAAAALDLLLTHDTLSPRDAIHAAVMSRLGIQRILTADKDFDGLESIQRIDPHEATFDERAAG